MGGSSIWLIPPPSHPLTASLTTLIQKTLPPHFAPEHVPAFIPHITLTSDVPTSTDPAALVAGLPPTIPPLNVVFEKVDIGQTFFTRVTLRVQKTDELKTLARELRRKFTGLEADAWAEDSYRPHLSLVYSQRDPKEVGEMLVLAEEVKKAEIPFGDVAWTGGRIVLVDTSVEIAEWRIVAEREV